MNLRKINFSEFRIYRTYYHYYTIITIDRSRNGESFFVPFFFLLSPRAGENDRTIQETGAINVSKSARARERESDQRIPCVGKKGRSARSLARVRYWNETNPRLPRAFALLIKGGPGPRPRASKRRAAKKRGARGRRRRDYLPALSPPPPIWKRARKATKDRAHSCIDAWCPCTCASHSTKIRNEAPVLCKFMRVEVCASLARGRGETATTHIGYWVIGYTSVLLSSCTANPAREH